MCAHLEGQRRIGKQLHLPHQIARVQRGQRLHHIDALLPGVQPRVDLDRARDDEEQRIRVLSLLEDVGAVLVGGLNQPRRHVLAELLVPRRDVLEDGHLLHEGRGGPQLAALVELSPPPVQQLGGGGLLRRHGGVLAR